MSILNERKGVNNWLAKQGIKNNEYVQYILSLFPEDFYRTSYRQRGSGRFQRFVQWFNALDKDELYRGYKIRKEQNRLKRERKLERRKDEQTR